MRNVLQLFTSVAEASLIVVAVYFALAVAVGEHFSPSDAPPAAQAIAVLAVLFVPIAAAAWWMFRVTQKHHTKRGAKFVTTAFVVSTPISLLISVSVAQIPGAYAAILGRPFGLIGAFVSLVVIVGLLDFAACSLALWAAGRFEARSR